MEIIYLLHSINHLYTKTTGRQLTHIIEAMLAMTGRVTMLGISRWTESGGSYRTIQRFFSKPILWAHLNFHLFVAHRYSPEDEVALAGDHTVVTKSGKETHGLDYFFSSIHTKAVKGLEFFSLSLINVSRRDSSPIMMKQTIRPEKSVQATSKKRAQVKKNGVARKEAKTKTSVGLSCHPICSAFNLIFKWF